MLSFEAIEIEIEYFINSIDPMSVPFSREDHRSERYFGT